MDTAMLLDHPDTAHEVTNPPTDLSLGIHSHFLQVASQFPDLSLRKHICSLQADKLSTDRFLWIINRTVLPVTKLQTDLSLGITLLLVHVIKQLVDPRAVSHHPEPSVPKLQPTVTIIVT